MISNELIQYLKRVESYDPKCFKNGLWHAHYDPIGKVWDMPYGITTDIDGKKITEMTVWSEDYVNQVFEFHLCEFDTQLQKILDGIELTQNQYDALFSLAWNIGLSAFKSSTVFRKLKEGKYCDVADAMYMWRKMTVYDRDTKQNIKVDCKGLVNRRTADIAIWERGDYGN